MHFLGLHLHYKPSVVQGKWNASYRKRQRMRLELSRYLWQMSFNFIKSSTVFEKQMTSFQKPMALWLKTLPRKQIVFILLLTYWILIGTRLITVNQGQTTDYICSHGSSPDILLFLFHLLSVILSLAFTLFLFLGPHTLTHLLSFLLRITQMSAGWAWQVNDSEVDLTLTALRVKWQ